MKKDYVSELLEEYSNQKELSEDYSSQNVVSKTKTIWNNLLAIFLTLLLFFSIIFLAFSVVPNHTDENTEEQNHLHSQSSEYSSEDKIVYDNIQYNNLTQVKEYKIKSSVVNKETGEVLSEEVVSFYPEESDVEFEVKHQIPKGEYTVYESLDWEE